MHASNLKQWINAGVLTPDSNPTVFNVRVYSRSHVAAAYMAFCNRQTDLWLVCFRWGRHTGFATLHCTSVPRHVGEAELQRTVVSRHLHRISFPLSPQKTVMFLLFLHISLFLSHSFTLSRSSLYSLTPSHSLPFIWTINLSLPLSPSLSQSLSFTRSSCIVIVEHYLLLQCVVR